jgi:cytoskeletal protein RodZ
VVVPEEPPISEAEVDDLLAAAPPPSAPPADEPVSEPAQPAPPADDPVAAIEPDPIVQEPDPVAPPPPADDPIAVADPPPTVQDPIVEPAPQPEQPAPVVVTGVATLSWSAPMTRANGAPLSMAELSGYEIYVVAESTGESSVITVSDPTALNYTVGNLAPDTYHFAISAVDTENHVSDMSPIVSKTIADVSVASAP